MRPVAADVDSGFAADLVATRAAAPGFFAPRSVPFTAYLLVFLTAALCAAFIRLNFGLFHHLASGEGREEFDTPESERHAVAWSSGVYVAWCVVGTCSRPQLYGCAVRCRSTKAYRRVPDVDGEDLFGGIAGTHLPRTTLIDHSQVPRRVGLDLFHTGLLPRGHDAGRVAISGLSLRGAGLGPAQRFADSTADRSFGIVQAASHSSPVAFAFISLISDASMPGMWAPP